MSRARVTGLTVVAAALTLFPASSAFSSLHAASAPDGPGALSHFDLARAYNSNHQTEQAKDELFSALEAAPGFRPAQKLLLELNAPEKK